MLRRTDGTRQLGLLLVLLLGGCEPDALTTLRGELAEDAAVPDAAADASEAAPLPPPSVFDAGPRLDAGAADAGTQPPPPPPPPPPPDAGVVDAGAPSPPARECYSEPFAPNVDLSDLEANLRARRVRPFEALVEALRRRWPAGYDLLQAERNDPYTGSFVDGSSFGSTMESSMTEVHEATHGWDYRHSLFRVHFDYYLRGDLSHSLSFDVDGFARSNIRGMLDDDATSLYSGLYLSGEQGSRGLLELLDETNCYINGLGAIAAIGDHVPYGISGRDGAVAFLHYVQLYLRRARTSDPALYARIQADAALREHLKIQWLRTHFFLQHADTLPRIGIRDGDIRRWLYAPDNVEELERVVGRCLEASPCLCD
jgi:hypothetical protein